MAVLTYRALSAQYYCARNSSTLHVLWLMHSHNEVEIGGPPCLRRSAPRDCRRFLTLAAVSVMSQALPPRLPRSPDATETCVETEAHRGLVASLRSPGLLPKPFLPGGCLPPGAEGPRCLLPQGRVLCPSSRRPQSLQSPCHTARKRGRRPSLGSELSPRVSWPLAWPGSLPL